jgi:LPS export ABC transporter protein LptC
MNKQFLDILTNTISSVFILATFTLFGCGKSNLEIPTQVLNKNLPDETSTNVTISEYNKGDIGFILKAGRIERFYDKRILKAYRVEITNYDQKKHTTTDVKADSTTVDDARNQIIAHGNVKMISPEGSVATNRMIWDRNADEIVAPDYVTLTQHGNTLRGKNLRTNIQIYPTEMDSVSAEGFFSEDFIDW